MSDKENWIEEQEEELLQAGIGSEEPAGLMLDKSAYNKFHPQRQAQLVVVMKAINLSLRFRSVNVYIDELENRQLACEGLARQDAKDMVRLAHPAGVDKKDKGTIL